jgi:hypothetical protein
LIRKILCADTKGNRDATVFLECRSQPQGLLAARQEAPSMQ